MKQTAVEWLVKKLSYETSDGTIISHHLIINKLVDQAKAMEKEQMNNAYNDDRPNLTIYESNEAFEQYYNETFKSE